VMASPVHTVENGHGGRRKSILDLAPLELDCMNALWPLGEATVRDVQQALLEVRPRAYTTIMTILDRLAHKGVVSRRKIGRAYLYRPTLTPDLARESAVERLVAGFFGGSRQALVAHLRAPATGEHGPSRVEPPGDQAPPAEGNAASSEASLDDTLL
jgi:BlaI family transcriptional regulator, penicillinase repressor